MTMNDHTPPQRTQSSIPAGKASPRENRISEDFDLLCDEHSVEDVKVMGVFGAMKRGLSKVDALAKYGLSEEYYDANIERVLHS